jgi:hypothetical protein
MIVYLVTADHAYTLTKYLREWAPALATKMQPVFYEEQPWNWLEHYAVYIFSDIERLNSAETEQAIAYADRLKSLGFRVLNHPSHAPTRLALQQVLHEAGINPFRMLPIGNHPSLRFPVFLRLANSHQGSIGDLIHSQAELEQRMAALDPITARADDLVVVEYCDTRSSETRYLKYSAMQIGDQLIPRHVMSSDKWMIKTPDIVDAEAVRVEKTFLFEFAPADAVSSVFALASIEFGRIDFGLQNGELRVWEINTNPTFMPSRNGVHPARAEIIEQTNQRLMAALSALDTDNTAPAVWRHIARRHERRRKLWWLRHKLFGSKRL